MNPKFDSKTKTKNSFVDDAFIHSFSQFFIVNGRLTVHSITLA